MGHFKNFFEGIEEELGDIQKTLGKIPQSHANLVKGFDWKFFGGNTLHGDEEHIGYMDQGDREIGIAAPWNYGREFTVLHEIGHQVWATLDNNLKNQWVIVVNNTKNKQNQNAEELFCMAYANHYVKNRIVIHDHPEWHQFIEMLPR